MRWLRRLTCRRARHQQRWEKRLMAAHEREFPLCEDRSENRRLWIEP